MTNQWMEWGSLRQSHERGPVPVMPCWMCEGQGLGRLGWLPPTPPDISPPHPTIIVGHSMLASMRR